MATIVDLPAIDTLITTLREQGRTVIGPIARDGVILHDEITTAGDLPKGWTEDQDGGTYRLRPTNTDEVFAFSSPSESWKRFVNPPRSLLIRGHRSSAGISIEEPVFEIPPMAFFGIRSCDLAALDVLDRVYLDPAATDPHYAARRADVFIVAAGCGHPGKTCFCSSMNTGPSPTTGYDLALTELNGQGGLRYLIEAGSDRGHEMLDQLDGRPVTDGDNAAASAQHAAAVAAMGRSLDPLDPPLAALDPEHPQWADVAERCLACGNCTMVCPTCFCSTTQDTTDLSGTETERWRVWDSCFTLDFTSMHGHPTRPSTASRYRQWLLHKLVTWHDQFDVSGCVGCGRCITWCPVGIDLTAEIAALARTQKEPT